MNNKLHKVFQKIEEVEPPRELKGIILSSIELEKNRWLRIELLFSRIGFAGSLFILLYTSFVFGRAIFDSEFWHIALLIVSDLGIVVGNWREYTYSLLETMPVFNIIAILLPLFSLLLSFNFYSSLNSKNHGRQKVHSI